ncbi:MAG: prephenate/arogenate dehydrogenase [Aphanocapsa lilacina HA4352-LM1]|jgi:arogenate dehydrogenase (NADP+)|nr:prephenate/arogenate dehydrogenase [Aphanocapsa lilacina HA4352-LM1]
MQIGIVGLGLIGGSLAHDLGRHHEITGVSCSSATVAEALSQGLIRRGGESLGLLGSCELVFVCTPIGLTLETIRALAAVLPPETILTDVASVKAAIVPAAEALWPNFVGGHPMAGGEAQGLSAARAGLFRGRPYVLTPTPRTPAAACTALEDLVGELGARLVRTDPETHDRAVARISHLPVFVGAALLLNLAASGDPTASTLASSGFFDTTRVGGGNPQLGAAMAEWNRAALLAELRSYRDHLGRLEQAIDAGDWQGVEQRLGECRKTRREVFKDGI